jgi:ribulose-5-phosphate 4-epimerase/fuculose-1-phosphate aldolase
VDVRPVFHMAGFLGPDAVPVSRTPGSDMLVKSEAMGAALAAKLSDKQPVVLQHKHGFTTYGRSVEEAMYRAIYMQTNCKLLAQAITFSGGNPGSVEYLSADEAAACRIMNEKCQDKSFRLWLREAQTNRMYENEEGEPEKGKVAGMRM